MKREPSHYDLLEKHLPNFLHKLSVRYSSTSLKWYADHVDPLLSAHGDKFYQYSKKFEDNHIPFWQGVAVGLLTYFEPFTKECRETKDGWVPVDKWVVDNFKKFEKYFDK